MRRATAWGVVVGVLAVFTAMPSSARAEGFWASIAAGAAGSTTVSDYTEFYFESPHAPPLAVTVLSGTNAQATTGGGTTFFSPAGTPVLLPTSDGYATLTDAGGSVPTGSLPKFAGGTQASGAPVTAQPVPSDSSQVAVTKGTADANGSSVLTVGVTDPNGNLLGQGEVTVGADGWWVIGLGPALPDIVVPPDPIPDPDPIGGGGGGNNGEPPPEVPPPTLPPTGGPVATPEPATIVLVGLGGLSLAGFRRLRRK